MGKGHRGKVKEALGNADSRGKKFDFYQSHCLCTTVFIFIGCLRVGQTTGGVGVTNGAK